MNDRSDDPVGEQGAERSAEQNAEPQQPHETLQGAIRDADALLSGQERAFDVDGRSIVVRRNSDGVSVVSEGRRAVVIRPTQGGLYIVTGATIAIRPSQPSRYAEAIDLALERLRESGGA